MTTDDKTAMTSPDATVTDAAGDMEYLVRTYGNASWCEGNGLKNDAGSADELETKLVVAIRTLTARNRELEAQRRDWLDNDVTARTLVGLQRDLDAALARLQEVERERGSFLQLQQDAWSETAVTRAREKALREALNQAVAIVGPNHNPYWYEKSVALLDATAVKQSLDELVGDARGEMADYREATAEQKSGPCKSACCRAPITPSGLCYACQQQTEPEPRRDSAINAAVKER